ncbi:MAG TPA: TonB-dependent receptor [Hymenobacter sp.]|uniref:TonB-dependent receptor n=1 Tax=Hymenobacter sp. TaxID=1898978 RepID=UPI002D800B03|nr:TonB-dependent receptor [Hymenobacter sp.]HET9503066.1 TonB-dependent receptor [Hymenobacter sp.]
MQQAHAQDVGTLRGKVIDADRQAAVGVLLGLKGTTHGATTDNEGAFVLKAPAGSYTLTVQALGAEKREQAVTIEPGRTTTIATIVLRQSSAELDAVTVTGQKINKYARKQSGEFVSRLPISNLENAQTYSVVTKELLQDQVVTNTSDALYNAPGVSGVSRSGGSGGTGLQVRLRGFTSSTSLRNGLQTAQLTLSDPQLTERIEVVKGPNGTLYGTTGGPGGLINRVTKRPYRAFGGEVSYTGGSWDQQRATLDINTPLLRDSSLLVRVNAVVAGERSFQDAGQARSYLLAPSVTYLVNDRLSVDLDVELYNTRFNNTSYSLGNALFAAETRNQAGVVTTPQGFLYNKKFSELSQYINFDRSYTTNDFQTTQNVYNVFGRINYKLAPGWQSQTLYSLGNADYLSRTLTLGLLPSTVRSATDNAQFDPAATRIQRTGGYIPSNFSNVQVQQNFIGDFKIGTLRNRMVVGLDHSRWFTLDNRVSGTTYVDDPTALTAAAATTTFALNQPDADYDASVNRTFNLQSFDNAIAGKARSRFNRRFYNSAAYVSDVLNVTESLLLSAGVRFDYFKVGEASNFTKYNQVAWSPKFGVVYQVLRDRLSVYGNYQNGFTNNQPQTVVSSAGVTTTTDYKPTQTIQWEGGLKLDMFQGRATANVSYYAIRQNDILRADPASTTANPLPNIQDDSRNSKGVDLELVVNPVPGLNLFGGYSYNQSRYLETNEGKTPEQAPQHVANFWLSYRLSGGSPLNGLGLGVGGNYSSDIYANAANTLIIDGYKIFNASIFYEVGRLRFTVKGNNLADERYWIGTTSLVPQTPRQFLGSVAVRF